MTTGTKRGGIVTWRGTERAQHKSEQRLWQTVAQPGQWNADQGESEGWFGRSLEGWPLEATKTRRGLQAGWPTRPAGPAFPCQRFLWPAVRWRFIPAPRPHPAGKK